MRDEIHRIGLELQEERRIQRNERRKLARKKAKAAKLRNMGETTATLLRGISMAMTELKDTYRHPSLVKALEHLGTAVEAVAKDLGKASGTRGGGR